MKIATFRIDGPLGPIDRFGLVRFDAANSDPIAAARQVATNTESRGMPAAERMSGFTNTM